MFSQVCVCSNFVGGRGGYPVPGLSGGYPSQVCVGGGTPSQAWMGGVAHPRSGWEDTHWVPPPVMVGGTPFSHEGTQWVSPIQTLDGVPPPYPDLGWGTRPPP